MQCGCVCLLPLQRAGAESSARGDLQGEGTALDVRRVNFCCGWGAGWMGEVQGLYSLPLQCAGADSSARGEVQGEGTSLDLRRGNFGCGWGCRVDG